MRTYIIQDIHNEIMWVGSNLDHAIIKLLQLGAIKHDISTHEVHQSSLTWSHEDNDGILLTDDDGEKLGIVEYSTYIDIHEILNHDCSTQKEIPYEVFDGAELFGERLYATGLSKQLQDEITVMIENIIDRNNENRNT